MQVPVIGNPMRNEGTRRDASIVMDEPRRRWWQQALWAARARSERALHRARRRRAVEQLLSLKGVRSILFLCEGNIYRSPFAAACFQRAARGTGLQGLQISSAGLVGQGGTVPSEALALAVEYGIDLSAHQSQRVNGALLARFNVVFVMEARQARELTQRFGAERARILVLGDFDPDPIEGRSIADPRQAAVGILHSSYARLNRCVRGVVELLASDGPRSRSGSRSPSVSAQP